MSNQVWLTTKVVPFFGSDYDIWKIRMEAYLMIINEDVWLSMIYGERNEFNTKAKEIIMKGLSKLDYDKVWNCKSTMELLDRL